MKASKTVLAGMIGLLSMVSLSSHAQESALQAIVSNMVKNALYEVSHDIDVSIKRKILTSAYASLEQSENAPMLGKVEITDIKSPANVVVQNADDAEGSEE